MQCNGNGEAKVYGDVKDHGDNNDDVVAGAPCGIELSANARSWKQGQV